MQIYHSFSEIRLPEESVCTVGAFDGVHLGHQQLLRAMVNDARTRGMPAVVVTFFPHPRVVLGRAPALYLTMPDEKAEQMQVLGIDILLVLEFTRETIQTTAAEFVRLMIDHLKLASLWIGPDFALGNRRQGNAAYLSAQGTTLGFVVNILSPVSVGTEAISSTRIRASLARGDIHDVNLCLGRPFRVTGVLINHDTVVVPEQHVLPASGEYLVSVCGVHAKAIISGEPVVHRLKLDTAPHVPATNQACTAIDFLG